MTGNRTAAGPARTRLLRTAGTGAAIVVVAGCVAVLLARPLGVSGWPLLAQLLSFRLAFGLVCVLLALGFGTALLLRHRRRPGRRPSPRTAVVLIAVLITGVIGAGTALARGQSNARVADPDLTVVQFNTFDTATTAAELAALVRATGADIVTLPEARRRTVERAARLLGDQGLPFQTFSMSTPQPFPLPVSALVSTDLGTYRQVPGPDLLYGALQLEPVEAATAPTIVAAHPVSPALRSMLTRWRSDTHTIAGWCAPGANMIVGGDLNATVDHPAFNSLTCVDAATQAGSGAAGTWPAWLPGALAAPIDHVIIDPQRFRAVAAWTERVGASDHRALVVQLRLLNR